ncbi:MAG: glycosyltransferase family 39 protein [Candidatus Nanoarchaeia archaeon]
MKPIWVITLLVFILAAWPAFVYDVPVAQTDGASYYVYADTLNKEGWGADNPRYNWPGSEERSINEYPPFSIMSMAFLLWFFDPVILINGLYGAIFAVIGVVFLWLFVKDLVNENAATIAAVLFGFSVRAYYTLTVGSFPSFTAYCLTWPALYFAYRAFTKGGWEWLWAVIATGLVSLTYPVQALYVLFLQSLLWVGLWFEGSIEVKFPEPKVKLKELDIFGLRKLIGYGVVSGALLGLVLIWFVFTGHARSSWIAEWVNGLVGQTCITYPCIWKYFFVIDGPLLVVLALAGILYALYENKWGMFGLGLGSLAIVLADFLLVHGDMVIVQFLYRYYTTFFVILAVFAAYVLERLIRVKPLKKAAWALVIVLFAIQAVKVVFFFGMVGPAMLPEDMHAAEFIKDLDGNIVYLNNVAEKGTFRAFKWVHVFAEHNDYAYWIADGEVLTTAKDYISEADFSRLGKVTELSQDVYGDYDYVYVGDSSKLKINGTVVFAEGLTKIYEVKHETFNPDTSI